MILSLSLRIGFPMSLSTGFQPNGRGRGIKDSEARLKYGQGNRDEKMSRTVDRDCVREHQAFMRKGAQLTRGVLTIGRLQLARQRFGVRQCSDAFRRVENSDA